MPPGPSTAPSRAQAMSWIEGWLGRTQDRRSFDIGQLQANELTHFVAYSPETAANDLLELSPADNETYGPVADWLEDLLVTDEA